MRPTTSATLPDFRATEGMIMELFRRMFITATIAGAISGLIIGIFHQFTTVQIIYDAEVLERTTQVQPSPIHEEQVMSAWVPPDGAERIAYTILADVLTGIGFSLLLVAAFAIAGTAIDWRRGFAWGVAAFAAFVLAPSLGLPPEIPGTSAAPLGERQLWWASTAVLTALAMALLSRKQAHPLVYVIAMAFIVFPHALGAPQAPADVSAAAESIAHRFIVASTISGLLFWTVAGTLAGLFYRRVVQSRTAAGHYER
jgi:cobalt transporter subunit CbtA